VNWRWTFWLGLIFALVPLPLVMFLPETYAPVLLQQRAARLRKETGNRSIVAPLDLTARNLRAILTVTLTRPIRMIIHESIVSFTCVYLSLAYAIFYIYFQAYPIVFEGLYPPIIC
jgi:MFS family permease